MRGVQPKHDSRRHGRKQWSPADSELHGPTAHGLSERCGMKSKAILLMILVLVLASVRSAAQSSYQAITVNDGGTITGTVKWTGPVPKIPTILINKDPEICDPQGQKKRDLERLVISSNGGVANTVVFLKDISRGKAMDLPEGRQFLNQKPCRYEPHVLLVPDNGTLQLKRSDPVLHTVHMSGASD